MTTAAAAATGGKKSESHCDGAAACKALRRKALNLLLKAWELHCQPALWHGPYSSLLLAKAI